MQVSVVIPVYNARLFLAEAVRSALEQPETAEVLLVEDACPDGSLAVCQQLADEHDRVRLLRHPGGVNRGAAASRNLGILEARFPFISFLDADDLYLPGRFRAAAEVFAAHPEADGVYGFVAIEALNGSMIDWVNSHLSPDMHTFPRPIPPGELFEHMIEGRGGGIHTNGITVRRELFERTGLFDVHLRMIQDLAMWWKMAAVGTLLPGSLDEPISVRRLHGENRCVRHRDQEAGYVLQMLDTVASWARSKGLPDRVQHTLLERQFRVWHRFVCPTYRFPRVHWVAFLAGLPFRQPVALRNRVYLNHLRQALFGLPRLRRVSSNP